MTIANSDTTKWQLSAIQLTSQPDPEQNFQQLSQYLAQLPKAEQANRLPTSIRVVMRPKIFLLRKEQKLEQPF